MSLIQLQNLRKYLADSSFTYTEEWLLACVEWVKENFPTLTDIILQQQVSEQWKDVNLEDLGSRCLPENLSGQKCVVLQGRYGVQMNSVQDIGESSYSQWNRLKKLENENTNVAATDSTEIKNSWDPKPRRCLYLTLTDGNQKVYGLELTHIPCLSVSLKPGIKLVIMGPVESRRGVLQLRPSNIKVIGGEVEELLQTNSTESILREVLHNPPENNNLIISNEPPNVHNPDSEAFPSDVDDDDIFMEIDENIMMASSNLNTQNTANAKTQRIDDSNETVIITQIERAPVVNTPITFPIMISKRPYIFLKQVHENWDSLAEKSSIVCVKACVATVVSNIQVSNGSWTLTVTINDGTGFLNCRVSPEILNNIIGFNPLEMKQIKATKTSEAKQKIAQGMRTLTQTLVHLNAIVGIKIGSEPVIVNFIDLMLHHLTAIKERISRLTY